MTLTKIVAAADVNRSMDLIVDLMSSQEHGECTQHELVLSCCVILLMLLTPTSGETMLRRLESHDEKLADEIDQISQCVCMIGTKGSIA